MMSHEVAERCVQLMEEAAASNDSGSRLTVDLTGGAPELTPQFRCGARGAQGAGNKRRALPELCQIEQLHLASRSWLA